MDLYYIGLHQVENVMRDQFDPKEDPERQERRNSQPERPVRAARLRLAAGRALYALANVIDPGTPVPSRQH